MATLGDRVRVHVHGLAQGASEEGGKFGHRLFKHLLADRPRPDCACCVFWGAEREQHRQQDKMTLSHEELQQAAKQTKRLRGFGNSALPIYAIMAVCAGVGYYYKIPDIGTPQCL